jgi:hypothetical protein
MSTTNTTVTATALVQEISLPDYLQDTMEAMDPSATMTVTQQHVKPMIRALLGSYVKLSKADLDAELRSLSSRLRWSKAEDFVLEDLNQMTPPDDAPNFQQGIETDETFQAHQKSSVSRFFSFLARGRVYQGNLDRLLEANQPELLPRYQEIVSELSESDLLLCFIDEQQQLVVDETTRDLLRQCIELEFPPASAQPMDGGKASGQKGELDLITYLKRRFLDGDDDIQIISPVFIQSKTNRATSRKCPYVIQIDADPVEFDGRTSELDAIVISATADKDDTTTIRILEVWEAKATLHPMTIHDALTKKFQAVSNLMVLAKKESAAELVLEGGKRYSILPNNENNIVAFKYGIFGTALLDPPRAARRTQRVVCERLLQTCSETVREALRTGRVQAPKEQVLEQLQRLLQMVQEIEPTVVVTATTTTTTTTTIADNTDAK